MVTGYDTTSFRLRYTFTGYDTISFRLRYQVTEYETTAYKLRYMDIPGTIHQHRSTIHYYSSYDIRLPSTIIQCFGYNTTSPSTT